VNKLAEFDPTDKTRELGRRLSRRVLREVISLRLDGQPIHNRRLIEKLRLTRKRPTVAKAVLALVVNYLGEIGVAVEVQ
jgi:hypothetical protein